MALNRAKIAACKLYYFDIKGRGEPIRLACRYAGLKLEDVRVKRETFQEMKENGTIPFGQLPFCEFLGEDGKKVTAIPQMRSILRLIGQSTDNKIYPADAADAARVDSMLDFEEDLFVAVRVSVFPARYGFDDYKDDEEKLSRRSHIASSMSPKLGMLEKILGSTQSGWSADTERPSIADFALNCSLEWLRGGMLDGIPTSILDEYPNIVKYCQKFKDEIKSQVQ
jgi:glutathione S-transferase